MPVYEPAVERLYDRLVDALERTRARPYEAPVTVAEIYQELVPYRSVRSEVGFSMNADYEHALLSLLASDLTRIEPEHARDEMRRELDSANPNVSIYRSYAGCDVWIRRPARPAAAAPTSSPADRESGDAAVRPRGEGAAAPAAAATSAATRPEPVRAAPRTESQPEPGTGSQPERSAGVQRDGAGQRHGEGQRNGPADSGARQAEPERGASAGAATEPRGDATPDATTECVRCQGSLPRHVRALFCPTCGAQQVSTPCTACGETVEPGWSYCVACGTEARPPARRPA